MVKAVPMTSCTLSPSHLFCQSPFPPLPQVFPYFSNIHPRQETAASMLICRQIPDNHMMKMCLPLDRQQILKEVCKQISALSLSGMPNLVLYMQVVIFWQLLL